ncbi:MAG: ABC transporter ATP-binding protein/permease [Erysipelotrichaceae bacterium]|nr:ABC transporter ATP-binding protein/permease [Erysipelotrichaceae bacterium]
MARKISEKELKEIQRKQGNGHGPASRFGGLKEKPKNTKETIKKLVNYMSYSKGLLFGLIAIVLLYTLVSLASNLAIKNIVSSLGVYNSDLMIWTKSPDKGKFITYIILLFVLYLLYCILSYLSSLLGSYLAVGMTKKMRNDLFAKIVRLPIKYTDTHQHGDIMSRMTNDVDNISNALAQSITSLVSGILTIIGCLALMIYYSPLLTLITLLTLLLSIILTFLMSKFARPLVTKQQSYLGILNSQTEEMVSGCKTVIAYNHQKQAVEEFNEYSNMLCHTGIKAQILSGSMGPLMNFIGNVGHFLVCYFGALFVINQIGGPLFGGLLTIDIVVMFVTLSKQFTRPINEIAQLYSSLITALAGAERVFKVLDEQTESFEGKVSFDPNKTNGTIDFEHVYFSYTKDKPVLKDFNVDIRSGHKIALVGSTGSGKTTIVNLLLRFYDIDSGAIKIDGININDISKKDLRDCISIVLQDAVLFEDNVENNVKYGKENATQEEFENALKMANCYKFVSRLPQKEKTILNEGATNISQGQRQLLTIARAVLANPKILILDEATSSVDTRTEKKIQDAMVKLMENRTSIIIAHRLSTIQDADLIVVLDQGHVVEMGNHKELIAKDGVYNRLYQTQYKGLNT